MNGTPTPSPRGIHPEARITTAVALLLALLAVVDAQDYVDARLPLAAATLARGARAG